MYALASGAIAVGGGDGSLRLFGGDPTVRACYRHTHTDTHAPYTHIHAWIYDILCELRVAYLCVADILLILYPSVHPTVRLYVCLQRMVEQRRTAVDAAVTSLSAVSPSSDVLMLGTANVLYTLYISSPYLLDNTVGSCLCVYLTVVFMCLSV